jgi:F-type H+-transporting ATPase subunit epsilon
MMASLGMGELAYRKETAWHRLTCFSGWCEVRPDRVNVLADMGERGEDIDVSRAETAMKRAQERLKAIKDEAGYETAHQAYIRAVTRLAVARRERGA